MDKHQTKFIQWATMNAEVISKFIGEDMEHVFDYSIESLKPLDELIERFSEDQYLLKEDERQDFIRNVGFYIFEVARRNFGGEYFWYDHLEQPNFVTGLPDFQVSLLAFEKVKGRLKNGYEDNIPFFFKGYSERIAKAKPGDNFMIT